eukprot:TRINITY_DN1176_c0_g1_i1.p1 TRINITY_DN1176_c0_g1~~TRINITY_DN1176_c0_g1_i1.p1  ORF type:complete len:123 (+),score=29.42 TRINITY_DN1176_c0_g1_i1:583-951(+)
MEVAKVKSFDRESHQLSPGIQTNDSLHPVQNIESTFLFENEDLHNFTMSSIYGHHMVLRNQMDKAILSQYRRLPILKSEMVGLDTLTKKDISFTFENMFGDPYESEVTPPGLHEMVERGLYL